ncbi:photosystem II S4 domain protein [Cyanobacterium stanieri LEGE 03274]|uniref:Photosystem II S4 domain protein n=1 Tax=Cyanobacterium stanieri LEGE 03274 TaxID=1828756 RepID=A0ABR9V670_9CHRO|nr:photosystem II S4 domain protein [Cyanobacterium stanieri]MBE9223382.1 photosystem II S4 domain protein [Cyanobacterium stanieri LEGE 03274]
MLPREDILNRVENRAEIAKVLDKAEQAIKTWELVVTDFLSPPVLAEVNEIFAQLTEVQIIPWGGFPQAERKRVGIHREEIPCDVSQMPVVALDIAGNFLFDTATHRDFLGAILGAGVVREKVGDIIVLGERGAQVVVTPEMVDFFESSLVQVRSVPVKTKRIELSDLKVREPKKKEMTTVEASLRLDAIASYGFGLSRSKMVDAINNGDVRVNWKEVTQSSYNLKTGDLVSFRGKGRLEIGDISITKKERYRIALTRFV